MNSSIEKVLTYFNFEHTCYNSWEDRIEDFWEIQTKKGALQFNTHEGILYIWSGTGMGSDVTHQYYTEYNSQYGYSVKVVCAEQLNSLLSILV